MGGLAPGPPGPLPSSRPGEAAALLDFPTGLSAPPPRESADAREDEECVQWAVFGQPRPPRNGRRLHHVAHVRECDGATEEEPRRRGAQAEERDDPEDVPGMHARRDEEKIG